MRQLKDIQILYAFHFDSLPKNEHETRARFLPRSLEFSNRRNDYFGRRQTGLFWIRNSELATDFVSLLPRQEHNQIAPGAGSIPSVSPRPRAARSPLCSSEV